MKDMGKMLLKCETTLNVYEHKSKTILCRVKVLALTDNNQNGKNPNTCRSITAEQWNDFDKELQSWLVSNENNVCKTEKDLCRFNVKPNLKVKIQKSNLITKDFLQCINVGNDGVDEQEDDTKFAYVLDCILEYTSMLPPKPSLNTDEYEPRPTTSINNITTESPLSYAPYTPSRRKRRFHSEYQVKTPGVEIFGYDLVEDTYSPKPIGEIANTSGIAQYNPAPIRKRSASLESQLSNINEVIIETDDERMPYEEYRSIRTRLTAKARKYKDFGEYVPQTQLIKNDIPAYKPTPIDETAKTDEDKDIKPKNSTEKISGKYKLKTEPLDEVKSEDYKSSDYKKKEKRKSKENLTENKQENKRSSKETKSTSSKDSKQSLNSTCSSEDEFETAYKKQHQHGSDKDNRKTKEDAAKTDKTLKIQKDIAKSPVKIKAEKLLSSDGDYSRNSSKNHTQDKDHKRRDKDKRRAKDCDTVAKTKETPSGHKDSLNMPQDKPPKVSPSSIRRSERSPSKPLRFIEEQENYKSRTKIKSERLSPLKNKDLFGTDDDDEDVSAKYSDSNNNGSNRHSGFQTPKSDKRNTSLLTSSASPTSTSKKKRKRQDCEQEKAGMSKWLGKKSSSNADSGGDTTSKSSKEKSSSSSRHKSSKKAKSSKGEKKERCKSVSPSPPPMDIVMPSKEELEVMRNKHKMQREENEKIKAALEKINIPAPKKVEQLSLRDMTLNELLDSFTQYETDLDEIFEKNRKKDHVKGNDGINHCLVIGLIEQRLQFKMLEKLSDVYASANNTTNPTLYANALLPEWIIRIFMEKYKLGRDEAVEHIQDQDAYSSYIDGQNEYSLIFED